MCVIISISCVMLLWIVYAVSYGGYLLSRLRCLSVIDYHIFGIGFMSMLLNAFCACLIVSVFCVWKASMANKRVQFLKVSFSGIISMIICPGNSFLYVLNGCLAVLDGFCICFSDAGFVASRVYFCIIACGAYSLNIW